MSALNLTLSTLDRTQQFGALLAGLLRPGDRLFLIGEIGAGKTTLARAIGAALQADPPLTSPTFVLMSEHHGTMPIWHGDAYRLPDGSDPLAHGLIDERQASGLTIMEWPNLLNWPPSSAVSAGPPPWKGTCSISMPAAAVNIAMGVCSAEKLPAEE